MSDDSQVRDYHDTASVRDDVACRLNEREGRERGDWFEAEFLPHLDGVSETDRGFALTVANTDAGLEAAATAVLLESRCCADQSFALSVPADDGAPVRLTIEGPEGTKGLLRTGFIEMFDDVPEPTA